MKIHFLTTGKTADKHLMLAAEEYKSRIEHYLPFEMRLIPELKNTKHLTAAEQKEKEAELFLKQIEAADELFLLDEKGKEYSSAEFAQFIGLKLRSSAKRIVFAAGGAYGFSEKIYRRSNGLVSLSKMTFPHQMARLIFLEQLYRAMTILKGEPYHHEG